MTDKEKALILVEMRTYLCESCNRLIVSIAQFVCSEEYQKARETSFEYASFKKILSHLDSLMSEGGEDNA